jgi:protein-tyrosine phosphatase
VRAAVAALVPDATRPLLEFPGGFALPNVSRFYDEFLTRTPLPTQDYHYVSYVHGDLNAANILIDAHDNVWVIDFFSAGRGHVLKDLAKFENDLLYLLTPVDDDAQLQEAMSTTLALRDVADLGAPLAELPDEVRSPHLVRAWEILRVLRSTISAICHEDRNPLQYQVARLRYAVHTLSFPEPSLLQKQSALFAACSLADQIARTVEANLVLRVDWVESPQIDPGRLGVTICPGRRDRDRDLGADLARLRAEGVDRLLCLSTDAELDWAGVSELRSRAEAIGLNYRWLPVPDQGTCTLSEAVDLVGWCRDALNRGESVVVTCMGGLGRSGMLAACTLVDLGVSPTAAVASVRAARGPRAIETSGQEEFVQRFADSRDAAPANVAGFSPRSVLRDPVADEGG